MPDRFGQSGFIDRMDFEWDIAWHTDRREITRLIGARIADKLGTKAYNAQRS